MKHHPTGLNSAQSAPWPEPSFDVSFKLLRRSWALQASTSVANTSSGIIGAFPIPLQTNHKDLLNIWWMTNKTSQKRWKTELHCASWCFLITPWCDGSDSHQEPSAHPSVFHFHVFLKSPKRGVWLKKKAHQATAGFGQFFPFPIWFVRYPVFLSHGHINSKRQHTASEVRNSSPSLGAYPAVDHLGFSFSEHCYAAWLRVLLAESKDTAGCGVGIDMAPRCCLSSCSFLGFYHVEVLAKVVWRLFA